MDETRFRELQKMTEEIMQGQPAVTLGEGESGGNLKGLASYQHQQALYDDDFKIAKSFWNGLSQGFRGVVGSIAAGVEQNLEYYQRTDPNYKPSEGTKNLAEWLKYTTTEGALAPYEVMGGTSVSQFGLDLTQALGQVAATKGMAMVPVIGGFLAPATTAAGIAGSQYVDLRKKGVSVQRAADAAIYNATVQAPLEMFSFNKLFAQIPANSLWKAKGLEVAKRSFTEGTTEFLQQYPEVASELYAENEGKSADEIKEMFWGNFGEYSMEALYSGIIGAIVGGGIGGARVAFDSYLEEGLKKEVHTEKLASLGERIERVRKAGLNPKFIAATINNNMPDSKIYLDGEVLYQYAQENNIEKVAEKLGVSVETIEKANENSDIVEVAQGNFEVAAAGDAGFYQAMEQTLSFDMEGYNLAKAEEVRANRKKQLLEAQQQAELDTEIKKIRESMDTALLPKAQAAELEVMLAAAAQNGNPDNPAQWLRDYALEFQRGGMGYVDGGYNQTADVTETENFKKWFGDSKVLDEEGKPLVVYHGTDADFEVFDRTKTRANMDIQGNFFSPWEIDARGYGGNVRAFYLNIKNPANSATAYKALKKFQGQNNAGVKAREYLIEQGYDGVNNDNEEYIAFYPEQIKAVDNQGTFDAKNPNVYKQENVEGWYSTTLSGDEFGEYADLKDLRKKAVDWYRENLQGTTAQNPALGEIRLNNGFDDGEFAFTRSGKKKMVQTSAKPVKMLAVKHLREIVERSNYVTESKPYKKNSHGVHYYYLHSLLEIDGVQQYVVVTVSQDEQGALQYYNHNVYNAEEYKKIEDTIQEALASDISSAGQNPQDVSSSNEIITDNDNVYKQKVYYDGRKKQAKGNINFQEGKAIITLFQNADASTVIHEVGHYLFERLAMTVANGTATKQQAEDFKTLVKRYGTSEEAYFAADTDGRRYAHEGAAEDFETYLMEGKAPSAKLRKVFARFSKWLKVVYSKVRRNENAIPLTDDVREVFDRMLAGQEEIAELERVNGYFAKLPAVITSNLTDAQKRKLEDLIIGAREKAELLLTKDIMASFDKERREEMKKLAERATPAITKRILQEESLYGASAELESNLKTKGKAKTLAQKYLNAEGKEYSDWKAELVAVREAIDGHLGGILTTLRSGMGKGTSVIIQEERDGRGIRVSNNDAWYQDFFKANGRPPTVKELRNIAYDIATGQNDVIDYWGDTSLYTEEAEQQQSEIAAELDYLFIREEELLEQKEAVTPHRYKGLSAEDRDMFDGIAECFGFASGQDLALQIQANDSLVAKVASEVQEIVRKQYPDLKAERELRRKAAIEDIYNNDNALLVATEQVLIEEAAQVFAKKEAEKAAKELAKKQEKPVKEPKPKSNLSPKELALIAEAKRQQAIAVAMRDMSAMSVNQIMHTERFIAQERKAAQKAAVALSKKDFARALGHKNQQAYWHSCVQASFIMRKKIEQQRRYIRKQVTAKRETWHKEDYFMQAAELLRRMGYQRKDYNPMYRMVSLGEFIAETAKTFDGIDIADWIVDETSDLTHPNSLSYAEFMDVVDALKNIKAIANTDAASKTFADKQSFEEVKTAAFEELKDRPDKWEHKENDDKKSKFLEKYRRLLTNADEFFERSDNGVAGFFTKNFFALAKRAQDKESEMVRRYEEAHRNAFKKWLPTREARKAAYAEVSYAELGGATLNKHNLVKMLIYLTTESSSKKLCSTYADSSYAKKFYGSPLWVEGDVEATRNNLIDFLGKVLTKEDVEYAQAVVDSCNLYWQELSDLAYRTKGFRPQKEEAYPLVLTLQDGTQLPFVGGYIPLVRDGRLESKPKSQDAVSLDSEGGANIRPITTNTGSTKSRDESVYPLDFRFGAERGAMLDTIHDICFRELLCNWRRILNDGEFRYMLKSKMGEVDYQALKEYAMSVAQPRRIGAGTSIAGIDVSSAISSIRSKYVYSTIMLRLPIAFQNLANIFYYGNSVEGFDYVDSFMALGNYAKNFGDTKGFNAMKALVSEKSSFMRERMEVPDISMYDMKFEPTGGKVAEIQEKAVHFGAWMLTFTDSLTSLPVWIQAYNKQISKGASEQEAIDYADSLIRRTIGSNRKSDLAPMFRDEGLLKMLTVFQSFFNTQFNQWAREARIDKQLFTEREWRGLSIRLSAFVACKWLVANAAAQALSFVNPFGDDDDDGYLNIIQSCLTYPFTLAGPLGQAAVGGVQEFMDMDNYGYRLSPIEGTVDELMKVAQRARGVYTGKNEWEDLAEPATNLLALAIGTPKQLNIIFWNFWDIAVNDMDFGIADLLRRRPQDQR